jgi:hypothetical protein
MRLIRCRTKKNRLFCANKVKFVIREEISTNNILYSVDSHNSKGQSNREPSPDAAQRIMKFYPNPATTFIKAEFQKNFNAGYSLQIINFIGKQVYEAKNVNSSTTLDLSTYTRGVYIYQLKDPSGKVIESGKFQVSK